MATYIIQLICHVCGEWYLKSTSIVSMFQANTFLLIIIDLNVIPTFIY